MNIFRLQLQNRIKYRMQLIFHTGIQIHVAILTTIGINNINNEIKQTKHQNKPPF